MSKAISRRQFLVGMGAGAGMVALAACAPAAAPAAPAAGDSSGAAPAAEPVTITLWSSFSGTNGEAEAEIVKRFNESQGDVIVQQEFQGSYEETAQKVTAALQARTAPDLSLLSDVWWFKFYLSQTIIPLDDLMNAQSVDVADYQDSLINEGVRKGQHYWVPFARSTPLFYYNKEKWAAAGLPDRGPETWDEFMEWAPQLVEMDGDEMTTSAFAHPDGASYIAWLFQGVAWQFNGAYSDADFTMRMTDDATIEAGEFYKATVHDYKWAIPSKDITADFINGLTASGMMSTGSMGGIKTNATFEFGTAMLPEKYQFGCCTGGSGLSILSTTPEENRGPAMEYIAFASNPESTTFWAQQSGYMPVRKSALESDAMQAYFEEFPQFKTATEQLALTKAQDAARVFVPNGDQIIGGGLERITVQADDVATAFADVNAILTEEAQPVLE
ncbi:MAG: ABC transporter substrate-binding protein, partial [Caldilineaceae bacterium]|nr:ABC transporter substrate-binding protein [Caldilineaceae bacterium]